MVSLFRLSALCSTAALLCACGGGGSSGGSNAASSTTQYMLQVSDGGNGTVTSSPGGIDCNSSGASSGCSQSFGSGTSVQLTAAPAAGYAVSAWSGACGGSATTCAVTMNAAQDVGITFSAATPANAALISDPYPSTDTQPSYFFVSCDGGAPVQSSPAASSSGGIYLDYSVGGLAPGAHVCSVAAVTSSGAQSSPESVSFTL